MKKRGGIYSRQHCPECGSTFVNNNRDGCTCPNHPDRRATKVLVKYGKIFRNFSSYDDAEDFLALIKGQARANILDERDYFKDNPLGFSNLADEYIEYQKKRIRTWQDVARHINRAKEFFGNRNIKGIFKKDLDKLYEALPQHLSEKSKHDLFTWLHALWVWVKDQEEDKNPDFKIPRFPKVDFQLKWRKIYRKETQLAVLDELKRISWHINPKIYIGCLWLATYTNVRPVEMISIKEGDIDVQCGRTFVERNKEKKPKKFPLLQEDIDFLKTLPASMPHLYFFRHPKGVCGAEAGSRFGEKYLYKWWRRACESLGVEYVPIYPGTRHSSLTEIRRVHGRDVAKDASGHYTNKALDRYLADDEEALLGIYAATRLQPKSGGQKSGDVVEFKKKS